MTKLMTSTTKLNWGKADQEYKRGQQLIKDGNWADGFRLHELRSLPDMFWNGGFKFRGPTSDFHKTPIWMPGNSVRGHKVIVWSEAGWGDMIQFSRFIPLLKEAGVSKVYAAYPSAIVPLIRRLNGIDKAVSNANSCPPASFRVKVMSLPYLLMEHKVISSEPVDRIFGSEGLYRSHDDFKSERDKPRIGLCWNTSNVSWNMDAKKIPTDVVQKFVKKHSKKYEFVSLQMEPTFLDSYLTEPGWTSTADKIQDLDYVISVDSAIAHCAASVGVPTMNLIGDETMACWRWYPKQVSTYWYDSMKCVWWDNYKDWNKGLTKAIDMI
jgi:hypothetical protein